MKTKDQLKEVLAVAKENLIDATSTMSKNAEYLPVRELKDLVDITIKLEDSLEDGAGVGTLTNLLKNLASDC